MKLLIFLSCVTAVVFSTIMVASQDKATGAEAHLRKACEIVWVHPRSGTVDRCVKRAMAAMGTNDQLRDNELKRLLTSGERKLEACQKELIECKEGIVE